MNKHLKNLIYGALIGISVIIPGLSGGTTALILGNYYKILDSISDIFSKNFKKIIFLCETALGGAIGIYIVSIPISQILLKYSFEFSYFAIGILIGSLPIFLNFKDKNILATLFYILVGLISTVLLNKIEFISRFDLLISILVAIALVLPGISLTNVLISFDYYDKVINAIHMFEARFLFLFFGSVLVFVVLLSGLIGKAYKKYPKQINCIVSGMIIASAIQAYPGFPTDTLIFKCGFFFLFGLFFSLFIFFLRKNTDGV